MSTAYTVHAERVAELKKQLDAALATTTRANVMYWEIVTRNRELAKESKALAVEVYNLTHELETQKSLVVSRTSMLDFYKNRYRVQFQGRLKLSTELTLLKKEITDAVSKGSSSEDVDRQVGQHPCGDSFRRAAQTSNSDSTVAGGAVQEVQTKAQEVVGVCDQSEDVPFTGPYNPASVKRFVYVPGLGYIVAYDPAVNALLNGTIKGVSWQK